MEVSGHLCERAVLCRYTRARPHSWPYLVTEGSASGQNLVVAWEWVAPTATAVAGVTGMFFTWLTGRQSRNHLEQMTRRAEETASRDRLTQERRDAYFAALRAAELTWRRTRYERQGEQDKVAEFDETWPRGKRIEMEIDAVIAVYTFGTPQARQLLERWREALGNGDEQRVHSAWDAMADLARRELGAQLTPFPDRPTAGRSS
jgi:hypothetical protein